MDHEQAIQQRAAERYLLGELNAEDRETYEAHYFDCPVCAKEVLDSAVFVDNAREVFREDARPRETAKETAKSRRKLNWFGWLVASPVPAFATVVLATIAGYQNFVTIPALQRASAPQALPYVVVPPIARSSVPVVNLKTGQSIFGLVLDVNSVQTFASYVCEFQKEGAGPVLSLTAAVPEPGTPLNLMLPTSKFPKGRYELVIRGGPVGADAKTLTEVERYRFEIGYGE
jgi:hypothetical protein